MAKSPDARKDSWAENVEKDSNALSKDKGSAESKCSNGDSSVIKRPNDNHNNFSISTEEQKAEEPDKSDVESDSDEEDSDWEEERHLREKLANLTVERKGIRPKTQTIEEVLLELGEDMIDDTKWLFRTSRRLTMGAVKMLLRRNDQLKALENRQREEAQSDPPLSKNENPQAADASHNKKELKSKKDPLKCFYCHEEGHFRRECPERAASRGRGGWNQSRGDWNQARGGYRGRGGWHQPRDGRNQTRGISGRNGIQIRGREEYQNRRPYVNNQCGERPQQSLYEYEQNEQHWAGTHKNWQGQSEFENERANHNPLN